MFTGLSEEIGIIKAIQSRANNRHFIVQANTIMSDLKIDDSVSINGACQTVVKLGQSSFEVISVEETLRKTTLSSFTVGRQVNLERALRLGDRLGGHIVQGHVDCVGKVVSIASNSGSWEVWIEYPKEFSRYVVPIGSICIDGVSLTVARSEGNRLMVAIIPHTLEITVLRLLRVSSKVNIEFDILGKYIEKMMIAHGTLRDGNSILQSWISQPDM